jgi:hypothetical protein
MDNISIIDHLIDILNSIDDDLLLALKAHENENTGGYFSIPRQVFCYIDYLGALMNDGRNSSENAISFMDKYFEKVNPKYSKKNNVIYNMWRHGTVHEYDPKVFKSTSKGFRLGWASNNSSKEENRKWHLSCFCVQGKPFLFDISINLFELVYDLKKSIRLFIKDIEFNRSFLIEIKTNYEKMKKEKELDSSDNNLLRDNIEEIINAPSGVINNKGSVIKTFNNLIEFETFKINEWNPTSTSS